MNCFLAITCVLALAVSSQGSDLGSLGGHGLVYAPGHASVDYYAYPRYAFEYAVNDPHTGDNKAQWEKRDGDAVKGAYSLVEPDGSLRVVEYWADDKSGFNAVVKRVGPNLHPVPAPVAPIYKAPIPMLASHGPITPISVGPVAGYSGLADAPLITGPLGGHGPVSLASVYRAPGPVVKVPVVAPVPPILPAPIMHAPIATAPILRPPIHPVPMRPLHVPAPVYRAPIISAPLPAPIVGAPYEGLGHLAGLGHGAGHLGGLGYLGGQGVGLDGHGLLQRGHLGRYGH